MEPANATNPAAATTASTATSPLSRQAATSKVDYDAFLKLLVAQMRNQDPTKPTDSAEYLSQLASFSSVEQQISANQRLDALISLVSFDSESGMLGKSVTVDGMTGKAEVVAVERQGDLVKLQLSNGTRVLPSDITSIRKAV